MRATSYGAFPLRALTCRETLGRRETQPKHESTFSQRIGEPLISDLAIPTRRRYRRFRRSCVYERGTIENCVRWCWTHSFGNCSGFIDGERNVNLVCRVWIIAAFPNRVGTKSPGDWVTRNLGNIVAKRTGFIVSTAKKNFPSLEISLLHQIPDRMGEQRELLHLVWFRDPVRMTPGGPCTGRRQAQNQSPHTHCLFHPTNALSPKSNACRLVRKLVGLRKLFR